MMGQQTRPTLFPYTTLFRSLTPREFWVHQDSGVRRHGIPRRRLCRPDGGGRPTKTRSEEHTSELQSLTKLVCRLLLEKKKKAQNEAQSCQKPSDESIAINTT